MKEEILSVGIDIGTTTTQLIFSRLTLDNTASLVTAPRIEIIAKEIIYRSEIHFTPLRSEREIDDLAVRALIENDYRLAGMTPDRIHTGAIIITGEAAGKQNAEAVLKTMSGLAGDFVVATAGPMLEGIIAGKGAGAEQESRRRGATVANLDIGGGTTNIAVFSNGDVIDTACLNIGGRLIRTDSRGRIVYVAEKIKRLAEKMNLDLTHSSVETLDRIARRMARVLDEIFGLAPSTPELELLLTDHDLRRDYRIDFVSFSGGVADCINNGDNDFFRYGDMGQLLGQAIADSRIMREIKVLPAAETIRATVVGAGSHTTNVSGSTISISPEALPLKNIPVLKLSAADEHRPIPEWAHIIQHKVEWFRLEDEKQSLALAFKGPNNLGFRDIEALATAIISGMDTILCRDCPLIVVIERDLAKVMGQTLRVRLGPGKPIICIDSVNVANGDYIDIGRKLDCGDVVPVIVKTLVLNY